MTMRIVIVGGGAGGLPLATYLGRSLGKKGRAHISLVDSSASHIWKPRYHEVATGAIDADLDAVDYRAHAYQNHYHFFLGAMSGVDRKQRQLILAAHTDKEGKQILPERRLDYDYLVLAIGSVGNDFGIPGVKEHCFFLDTRQQADRFHDTFLNYCLQANYEDKPISIAIVGGGATGVELAAELHHAVSLLKQYGHDNLDRKRLNVQLLEAGPRLLPALKETLAANAQQELERMGVEVKVSTMVKEVHHGYMVTEDGSLVEAGLQVWAAGIKAPPLLADLDLETTRGNLLKVNSTLQTSDPHIYAMGDCCACPLGEDRIVPPRAQSAQQQAQHLAKTFRRLQVGETPKAFQYRDRGSLVSLSSYSALGQLMGSLRGGNFFVEGWLARMMYVSLYRMHQAALYGWPRTLMLLLAGRFNRLLRPRLKLH
ncbi:NAD(P)/FAD-dependent oxidoreductase [Spongiibacter nanhainus]|uniref:NAD(P)/FAD-dependent oxidoreductase n=1 Tax=Spongiibacter nanhainus TaxID=2794344 RepID=A0A7T4R2L2_9GAMM|nr:NAD(P)/FAD-dependent oxidoreductase [Spongiibacter nanhainus]QQD19318.1 NAD(P)/FAD-dependent oxidoreductase [Spongiibacter nanhainus]